MKARVVTAATEYMIEARVSEITKNIIVNLNGTVKKIKYQSYNEDGKAMIKATIYYD